jgi:dephospho-CoA kinase
MTTKARIQALELRAGPKDTEAEAAARELREMPNDELTARVKEILANREPPAADDMSESAVLERKVRKLMARKDAERARQ